MPRTHGDVRVIYKQSRGFTLIEVMVALAISSLLFTVLISSLVFVLRAQTVLSSQVREGELEHRASVWFQSLVSAAATKNVAKAVSFRGSSESMEFETQEPLSPQYPGVPRVVRLSLKKLDGNRVALLYRQAGEETPLMTWTQARVTLKYLDRDGQTHAEWPVQWGADAITPALTSTRTTAETDLRKTDLPATVWLSVETPDSQSSWLASPRPALHSRLPMVSAFGLLEMPKQ